jgi:SecD/SecF fusion protein
MTRILVCVLPVLVAGVIVGWAYSRYDKGEGGFRLGVDLVGGTILVYEVDQSKPLPENFKIEELAAALKRRIDPNDLANVTIRPLQGNPPRVEIILPTGGRRQSEAEEQKWKELLAAVKDKYPPAEGKEDAYEKVPHGRVDQLIRAVLDYAKKVEEKHEEKQVAEFIRGKFQLGEGRRNLTGEEIENIKNLIAQQGRLEFRILANRTDDREAISAAEDYFKSKDNEAELKKLAVLGEPPPPPRREGKSTFPVELNGEIFEHSYSWVEIGKEELYSLHLNSAARNDPKYKAEWERVAKAREEGKPTYSSHMTDGLIFSREIPNPDRVLPKDRPKEYEYFVLTREPQKGSEITGDFLINAGQGQGKRGQRAVEFRFNTEGGNRFYDLTSKNHGKEGGFKRHLSIILDGLVRSAPVINEPIRYSGVIEGEYTPKEQETLIKILRAGALPATLKQQPVAENTIGATLGEDTIRKGTTAVLWAFVAVLAFMLVYYRFAGLVACVALLANLLLTVAFMVTVNAAFTLPGLAGLVLMLGMAVDANVLIYERLREERERGASLALAIRNGYDRAFPTIIDTHLCSLFAAIVLFVVGNDQLKGFGISLTVGLIISLFTSLFMTRTMFDLCLAKGWLKKLTMMHIFRRVPHIDFMAIRYYWFTATILLTILGASVFIYRLDKGGLNIDFVGGTLYSGQLREKVTIDQLREYFAGLDLPDFSPEQTFANDQELSTGNTSKLFTIRTSEKNATKVQRVINEKLGEKLRRIEMEQPQIEELKSAPDKAAVATLSFYKPTDSETPGKKKEADYASRAQVNMLLSRAFEKHNLNVGQFRLERAPESLEKEGRFTMMRLELLNDPVNKDDLVKVLEDVRAEFHAMPQPERLENFDSQLAAATQEKALLAIVLSWAVILLYLWFRFGSWTFGLATVLCLIHDLFFTLGAIAGAHYIHGTWLGNLLGVGDFKIDLASVAALLTLVGYSVSDTIVVFDRIREVRGKNPLLTAQMINDSVNQTLSRTILSAATVWFVVIVLYAVGGEGVHLFAFVMIVGVIVGTYSSIYIASPLLLIFGEGKSPAAARARAQAASTAIQQG